MKKVLILAGLSLLAGVVTVRADDTDDQYVAIIHHIAAADALSESGENAKAVVAYRDVQFALRRFQSGHPDWNAGLVDYRKRYVTTKIDQISATLPPPAEPAAPSTTESNSSENPTVAAKPTVASVPSASASAESVDYKNQIAALNDRIHEMEEQHGKLESSLKEALAAKKAAVNPEELSKANERIEALQQENEILKGSLHKAKTNAADVDAAALQKARKSLADANQKLGKLSKSNASLTKERESLTKERETLQAQIKDFEQQIAELKSKEGTPTQGPQQTKELTEARLQITSLQLEKKALNQEKEALEARLKRQERNLSIPAY
jgi:myosin heavy subunit